MWLLSVVKSDVGGAEEWLVACCCGTRDDDGERMIACDGCGCWSHTQCAGYQDDLPLPLVFLCAQCSLGSTTKSEGKL